jgi:hypothetical protein
MAINLRRIANSAIQIINTDIWVEWRKSLGSIPREDGLPIPQYAEPKQIRANVQALAGSDLMHESDLNQTSTMRKVYLWSNFDAGEKLTVGTPNQVGGDLLIFPQVPKGLNCVWLITQINEQWKKWACVNVVLQNDIQVDKLTGELVFN